MTSANAKPGHAALPRSFRRVRLELAREKGHPMGSAQIGYEFVAPLTEDGHIDAEAWKQHRAHCGVVRFRPGEDHERGHLVRKPGGSWAFHYDISGEDDDEAGYRFNAERFVMGEYVSVREDDEMHTFQVVSVQPI